MTKILDTNPETRMSIEDIRNHSWYKQIKEKRMLGIFTGKEKIPYNEDIFKLM